MQTPPVWSWPLRALPRLRTAGVFPLNDRGFAHHYRTGFHALHLHEYACRMRWDDQELALRPGTVTISPAGGSTSYDLPVPGMHWCVHFDPCDRSVSGSDGDAIMPVWFDLGPRQSVASERLAFITRQLAVARAGHEPALASASASAAMLDLLLWLASLQHLARPITTPAMPDAIDRLIRLIARQLHTPLRVPDLAAQVKLSHNYLARMFRQHMGTTIPRYILNRRIEQARLLLSSTDLPVKEVASRVGLPDPHHFNKQFRHAVGASPSHFRRARQQPLPSRAKPADA